MASTNGWLAMKRKPGTETRMERATKNGLAKLRASVRETDRGDGKREGSVCIHYQYKGPNGADEIVIELGADGQLIGTFPASSKPYN